ENIASGLLHGNISGPQIAKRSFLENIASGLLHEKISRPQIAKRSLFKEKAALRLRKTAEM
ncbi:MAG: hypothetical protein BZY81_01110, partial [SAR202 cluster bacterium Io17-Chloro-G4]